MSAANRERRDFLLSMTATAVAAVAQTPRCDAQDAAHAMRGRIRKAVKYSMVAGNASHADKFKMLKDIGYDGVEVRALLQNSEADDVRAIRSASDKVGLPIHGVVNSSNPNLTGAIDQVAFFGGNSVLHVVRYNTQLSYLQNYRETQEILRRALDHAESKKISILLENVWASYLIEPLGMARFIDEIGSEYVQAYFDIGNVVRWGWPQHWIEVLGKRVRKLDVKEYSLEIAMDSGMRKAFDVPMGKGSIEWDKVRHELIKIDYRGWATAEVRGGDRQRLTDIAEQMNQVFLL